MNVLLFLINLAMIFSRPSSRKSMGAKDYLPLCALIAEDSTKSILRKIMMGIRCREMFPGECHQFDGRRGGSVRRYTRPRRPYRKLLKALLILSLQGRVFI
jgi:hypothetical protein